MAKKTKKPAVSGSNLKNSRFSRRFIIAFAISLIVLLIVVAFAINYTATITGDAKAPAATAQCRDGRDNDGDARVDYPNDPGCSALKDASELNANVVCDDGKDNDVDGKIDMSDFGCSDPADNSEINCADGVCSLGETQINCPSDCGYPNSCSDTDGGNVVNVLGTVSGYLNSLQYSNSDYCSDEANVLEYYCSGTSMVSAQQSCGTDSYSSAYCSGNKLYQDYLDYYCSNGVCGSITTPIMQDDCDLRDAYSSNYCYNDSVYRNFVDSSCVSGMCINISSAQQFVQGCPYGCVGGVCNSAPEDSCFDSDGGLVATVKGTTSGYTSGAYYSFADYCVGNYTREYYCSGASWRNTSINCRTNTTFYCSNGACV